MVVYGACWNWPMNFAVLSMTKGNELMNVHPRIIRIQPVLICLLLTGLFVCSAVTPANAQMMKWTIDGVAREAIVVSPSKTDALGKVPVIFAFHGHGGNMKEAA